MAKTLIVSVINVTTRNVTQILPIDISTITDIVTSSLDNLIIVQTTSGNYYIKETMNDLLIQLPQIIFGKDIDGQILTSPNGNRYKLTINNDGDILSTQI